MFFFFEQIIDWFKTKESDYERSVERWIRAGDSDGYNYRTRRDYEHRYGEGPTAKLKAITKIVFTVILGLVGAAFFIFIINNSIVTEEQKTKEAYAGHGCKAHDMGDRVKVQYGDWADATGVIVGGCEHDEDYQIKLDKQMYNVANDGNDDPVLVEGRVLSVDTYRNLIKIEKE